MYIASPPALSWIKCDGNQWCSLLTVNLSHPHFQGLEGVYIVWHGGSSPWTVYVGQGVIRDRIAAHRIDKDILQFSHLGLFVTWAQVEAQWRDGIERFLADRLQPKVGVAHPAVAPISVNLPW